MSKHTYLVHEAPDDLASYPKTAVIHGCVAADDPYRAHPIQVDLQARNNAPYAWPPYASTEYAQITAWNGADPGVIGSVPLEHDLFKRLWDATTLGRRLQRFEFTIPYEDPATGEQVQIAYSQYLGKRLGGLGIAMVDRHTFTSRGLPYPDHFTPPEWCDSEVDEAQAYIYTDQELAVHGWPAGLPHPESDLAEHLLLGLFEVDLSEIDL